MQTKHYFILLVVAGLLITGNAAWKYWLDARIEEQEIAAEKFARAQETRRMEIFARTMEENKARLFR